MLRARLDINGTPIASLVCVRQPGGADDGWNEYACTYRGETFAVRHYRPAGAWALIATAAGVLAEAGAGRCDDNA